MFAQLQELAARHPVIGDVRGGRGLFAVVELVSDRATRAPIAPWPAQPDAMKALLAAARDEGVSFGSRGNLLILAPPLVIAEADLAAALALLDRLLARFFPAAPGAPLMSFRLTYATMFNPPEELHERFERALATVRGRLGATHPMFIDGKDVPAAETEERASPIDSQLKIGRFPLANAQEVDSALAAAHRAFPAWRDAGSPNACA